MKRNSTEEKIKRVRNRASYRFFQELYQFLKSKPSTEYILKKLYDVLDERRSFGSERNAGYAEESLTQVLKDRED